MAASLADMELGDRHWGMAGPKRRLGDRARDRTSLFRSRVTGSVTAVGVRFVRITAGAEDQRDGFGTKHSRRPACPCEAVREHGEEARPRRGRSRLDDAWGQLTRRPKAEGLGRGLASITGAWYHRREDAVVRRLVATAENREGSSMSRSFASEQHSCLAKCQMHEPPRRPQKLSG